MTEKTGAFDLRAHADEILAHAERAIARSRLGHYEHAGRHVVRKRLEALYEVLLRCIEERRLAPIVAHGEAIAQERFETGFDLREVQCAINVLEEAVWKYLIRAVPPAELAQALGLVSTLFGGAKDALAREYVALATTTRSRSLDLAALLEGTAAETNEASST